jgi:hydroxymethylbilane synthase
MTGLRLGTRASTLARTQGGMVATALRNACNVSVDLVDIKTFGDAHTGSLASLPQQGVFVSALRDALTSDAVDLAVHSFKDLPSQPLDHIVVAATPTRQSPFDALIARDDLTLDTLPKGARVGTGSPRRAARLKAHRPDLVVVDIRGNVDTRLQAVVSGELDAVVLAVAGLERLERTDVISEIMPVELMLPAPSQGALAVECRSSDTAVRQIIATIDDHHTRVCISAERAILSSVEASCASAIGALATYTDGQLTLTCDASGLNGEYLMLTDTVSLRPDDAVAHARTVGMALGQQLLIAGAQRFLVR